VLHFKVVEDSVLGQNLLQQLSQPGDVPLSVAQVIEQLPLGLLRCHLEGLVEGAAVGSNFT
jgi:hypothetical protein